MKGLYKKALAGEIAALHRRVRSLRGAEAPDVVVRSDRETVEESLERHAGPRSRAAGSWTPVPEERALVSDAAVPGLPQAGRAPRAAGGRRAAWRPAKLPALLAAGAQVTVVAPEVRPEIEAARGRASGAARSSRGDLDGAWLVVAAAPPEVNRAVVPRPRTRGASS